VFSFGFGQQSLHYGQIDGIDLENGDLTFVFQHNNCCGPNAKPGELTDLTPDFERDLLQQKVGIDVDRNCLRPVLEYGIADRIDRRGRALREAGHAHARVLGILRTATPTTEAEEQATPSPSTRSTRSGSATARPTRARTPRHRRHRRPRQGAPPQDEEASRSRSTSACRPATKKA
jgi:hypothetical protein